VCVFCGIRSGSSPSYEAAAQRMGEVLAREGIRVVYGGGKLGMMGTLANTVLSHGGSVVGVIPEFLKTKEVVHEGLSELHVVPSLHERKNLMYDLADAFIVLPGGLGTLDELTEVLTWGQLGLHRKSCGILNTGNYFHHFLAFFSHLAEQEMMPQKHLELLVVESTPEKLLEKLRNHVPPVDPKWVSRANL